MARSFLFLNKISPIEIEAYGLSHAECGDDFRYLKEVIYPGLGHNLQDPVQNEIAGPLYKNFQWFHDGDSGALNQVGPS